ncbi:glycosyl hydrolase [Bacteroidota bacterium]
MKTYIFWILILFLYAGFNSCLQKNSSESGEKISSKEKYLNYLDSLKGKGALAGQFIRWNYNASLEEIKILHDSSGQWLSMLGADYYGNFKDSVPGAECAYELTNSVLINYLGEKDIVNLSVHFNNPQTSGAAWDNDMDFDSLFVENSRVRKIFYGELDKVSVGLEELADANVNIMFRPFHEMNGRWFWWGKRKKYFKELWIMTYNYLVEEKGLKNMLWCYSPDAGQPDYLLYYPGDAYVDIVGLDAYTQDLPSRARKGYEELIALGKPFGFTEYGCYSGGGLSNPDERELFDYSIMGDWLQNDFPEAVFFLAWRDYFGMAQNTGVNQLLNHKYIIKKKTKN